jgi:hypothetical protein
VPRVSESESDLSSLADEELEQALLMQLTESMFTRKKTVNESE